MSYLLSNAFSDKERYLTTQHTPIKMFNDYESAEMVKYVANCFLATKISFANEIYQVCQKLNVNYDKVIESATLDERLGSKYGWTVPGPIEYNGKAVFGYGLSCVPGSTLIKMSDGSEQRIENVYKMYIDFSNKVQSVNSFDHTLNNQEIKEIE
jgi:UDP-glucose 6-dehydrogenase